MRLFLSIVLLLFVQITGYCQQAFLLQTPQNDSAEKEEIAEDIYTINFLKGSSFYEHGMFINAEHYFQKAYAARHTEEAAQYIYYALLKSGLDLEAGDFLAKNRDMTFAILPAKGGVENIYVNAGPRISGNNNAGNIFYADNGVSFRLAPGTRLWRSLNYLQQNDNLGHFRQYEYASAFTAYTGRGWTIRPSLHYAYLPYTSIFTSQDSLHYGEEHRGSISFSTQALQTTNYTLPGHTHYISGSFNISKRYGAVAVEAEPTFQYISGKNSGTFDYSAKGVTDSFINDRYDGSKPYSNTGTGTSDTSYNYFLGQFELAVNYRLPLKNEPIFLRAGAYFLMNNNGDAAFAYTGYALVKTNENIWLHVHYTNKGNQPLVTNWDGVYYNYANTIKARLGLSLQLFPLKHFSPWITYQYEQGNRSQDDARLVYHSIYLTFNYHL